MARADQEVVFSREQENQGERAPQAGQRDGDGVHGRAPVAQRLADEMRHDLRVRFGLERDALGLQFGLQLAKILDDAVVDYGKPVGRVRMSVGFIGLAMGRPARVADADRARQRRL